MLICYTTFSRKIIQINFCEFLFVQQMAFGVMQGQQPVATAENIARIYIFLNIMIWSMI